MRLFYFNSLGLWERTITVGSIGKMFGVTGWRVGFLIGHPDLIRNTLLAHARIVFCANAPFQEAAATSLEIAKQTGFFEKQRSEYIKKRDLLLSVFDEIGLNATVPQVCIILSTVLLTLTLSFF